VPATTIDGDVPVPLQDNVDGTTDGSATVTVEGHSDTTSWSAPSECQPTQQPPPSSSPPTEDPTLPPSEPATPDVD
jgi:hypothetical protein